MSSECNTKGGEARGGRGSDDRDVLVMIVKVWPVDRGSGRGTVTVVVMKCAVVEVEEGRGSRQR